MVWHNPRAEMPEDAKFIPVTEGHEHGYWGQVPDLEDNEVYTVDGAIKTQEQARKDHEKREAEWAKADKDRNGSEDSDEEKKSDDKKPAPRRSSTSARKEEDS